MSERIVKESGMATLRDDPTIDELLADSLVRAVMRADRVDPIALGALLRSAAVRVETGAARLAAAARSRPDGGAGLGSVIVRRLPSEPGRLDSLAIAPHIGEALRGQRAGRAVRIRRLLVIR